MTEIDPRGEPAELLFTDLEMKEMCASRHTIEIQGTAQTGKPVLVWFDRGDWFVAFGVDIIPALPWITVDEHVIERRVAGLFPIIYAQVPRAIFTGVADRMVQHGNMIAVNRDQDVWFHEPGKDNYQDVPPSTAHLHA